SLYDGEESLPGVCASFGAVPRPPARLQMLECLETASEPAHAALAGIACTRGIRLSGYHVVELHDHVRAKIPLDLHHGLGREREPRAIHVTAELDSFLAHGVQGSQGEHLETTGVREDRPVPVHERVEPSERAYDLVAGAEMQVVRVGQQHGGSGGLKVARIERLHRCERPDGHERRSEHLAVRRPEAAGASAAARALHREGEVADGCCGCGCPIRWDVHEPSTDRSADTSGTQL